MNGALVSLLAVAAFLAAANGANDAGKPVATLAGSRATSYRGALLWGTLATVAGALASSVVAVGLARTFASGFLFDAAGGGGREATAAAIAAAVWVCLATWRGRPVSTTHAIAGALIGAGIASGGAAMVKWAALVPKVFIPLALSPLAAAALGAALHPLVERGMRRWRGACLCVGVAQGRLATEMALNASGPSFLVAPSLPTARVGSDPEECRSPRTMAITVRPVHLHWLSAGLTSFARGLNDAPKIAALSLPLMVAGGAWKGASFVIVAIAMGLGSILGGARIARTLGEKIARLEHHEALGANLATSILVLAASPLGLPVSTTHVATGAITGAGLSTGARGVSWGVLRDIVIAWMVTLPVSALLGAAAMRMLGRAG